MRHLEIRTTNNKIRFCLTTYGNNLIKSRPYINGVTLRGKRRANTNTKYKTTQKSHLGEEDRQNRRHLWKPSTL